MRPQAAPGGGDQIQGKPGKIPDVSVIIACYNAERTIAACLDSLIGQESPCTGEIIVVDSSSDRSAEIVESRFPEVRLVRLPERAYPGTARNAGLKKAQGDLIAFIDADCLAEPGWMNAVTAAHRDCASLAIGGTIANGNPESSVGWAAFLCEFSQWIPGSPKGDLSDMPTANLSYKREAFRRYGLYIDGTYCSDTEFHWRLRRDGHRIRLDPSIRARHCNIDRPWAYLRHEFQHGMSFARIRAERFRFSGLKRALYSTGFPLIAIKLFLRTANFNLRNRTYFRPFLKAVPLLMPGILAWSAGESAGYLAASGPSRALF